VGTVKNRRVRTMGYYTYHEMEHNADEETTLKIEEKIKSDEVLNLAIGEYPSHCKWYDHDKDMLDLSLEFPGVTFILSGEGEDSDDQWKTKYKDGKQATVRVIISFPAFPELE